MKRTGKRLCAWSVILLFTGCTSTARLQAPQPPPPPAPPPPTQCLQQCRVNTCTLSAYYVGYGDDELRVQEELNCTEVNANDARVCGALHAGCSEALRLRAEQERARVVERTRGR